MVLAGFPKIRKLAGMYYDIWLYCDGDLEKIAYMMNRPIKETMFNLLISHNHSIANRRMV